MPITTSIFAILSVVSLALSHAIPDGSNDPDADAAAGLMAALSCVCGGAAVIVAALALIVWVA